MPEFKRHTSSLTRKCKYCAHVANAKGIASHERACKKRLEDAENTLIFSVIRQQEIKGNFLLFLTGARA